MFFFSLRFGFFGFGILSVPTSPSSA